MTATYKELVAAFKPQFGNANHITVARIIPRVEHLQARVDQYSREKKRLPKNVLKEIEDLEKQVVRLLEPGAPLSPYPPSYSRNV